MRFLEDENGKRRDPPGWPKLALARRIWWSSFWKNGEFARSRSDPSVLFPMIWGLSVEEEEETMVAVEQVAMHCRMMSMAVCEMEL